MAGAPANTNEFLDLVRKSGVVDEKRLDAHVQKLRSASLLPPEPAKAAGVLIRDGFLTHFQAENILAGKWRRFTIGKYKVLEKIGSGGMGQVYLCEHKLMRRRVAVKVLPTAKAADDSARERFYREARAVAALDHPNIVHAYDIDQDENLHFLVMEYVDGASLQDIVKKTGPLDLNRACHYLLQAAQGLEHAHQAGLVHRDIKPGNIMVDRTGVVKILDMGLARFFHDEDDMLTKKYDDYNMGTLDYQAPEQAIDSHGADIRADIYGLGATFFFTLTGKTPFGEGTLAQKAMWHQTRQPKPLAEFRSDVPQALQDLLDKMMAKEPADRFQVPAQVAEALAPYTKIPIIPPPEAEMPRLSLAASGAGPQDGAANTPMTRISAPTPRPTKPASSGLTGSKPPSPPGKKSLTSPPPPATRPSAPQNPASGAPAAPAANKDLATMPAPPLPREEKAPWDSLADTENPAAKDDTGSHTVIRPDRGGDLARRKESRRLWTAVIALSVLLILIVGILFWAFVLNRPATIHARRAPLAVSKDGKGFKSIRQALHAAQPGDVIEIHDPMHEENLIVDVAGTDVTLQAAPGVLVHWGPAKKDERTSLIHISKAPGFRLRGKGITLDGQMDAKRRVQDLIFITLTSPGLVIEDLQFQNIGQNAVKIMNAQGTKDHFIRLLNLAAVKDAGPLHAVGYAFDANPDTSPPVNDYIEISPFNGVKTPVLIKDGSVMGPNVSGLQNSDF